MGMPYPEDRARARMDKGEQPYKDAKEAVAEEQVELEREAPPFDTPTRRPTPEQETELQEQRIEKRLSEIGDAAKHHDEE